jgi:hypothetical protein
MQCTEMRVRLELRKFALKLIQAMIRVEKELQNAPASERRWEVLKSKPLDLDKLSLEEQCIWEVAQEQIEKAENEGAVGNGAPGDITYTVTKEMVEAKMREKTQKQN